MTGSSKEYEYAVALFDLARETNNEETVLDGLLLVYDVWEKTPELLPFLKSPGVSKQIRLDTIRQTFEGSVPEYVVSMLCLLCEQSDIGLFDGCVKEYEKLYHTRMNLAHALVTSAVALTEEEKSALCQRLERISRAKTEVDYQVDPSLLGGLTVEMDGMILDGSLKHRLQTMKDVMDK